MKTSTQNTVIPKGWTGDDFNKWQKYLQRQIDQIKNTSVALKLR